MTRIVKEDVQIRLVAVNVILEKLNQDRRFFLYRYNNYWKIEERDSTYTKLLSDLRDFNGTLRECYYYTIGLMRSADLVYDAR